MPIKYFLLPNYLNKDNSYHAKVKDQRTKNFEDLIDEMIESGSTVTKAEALAVLEEYHSAIERSILSGDSVSTPLFHIKSSITGRFDSETDTFDASRHQIRLNLLATKSFHELTKRIKTQKTTHEAPAPTPKDFKDMETMVVNQTLTAGGVAQIKGNRLKIDPNDKEEGVFLIDEKNNTTRVEQYIRIKPKELIFMIPERLKGKKYTIEVRHYPRRSKKLRRGKLEQTLHRA